MLQCIHQYYKINPVLRSCLEQISSTAAVINLFIDLQAGTIV